MSTEVHNPELVPKVQAATETTQEVPASATKGLPSLWFQYGEDTKIGVTIKDARFNVYALPQQKSALVETVLTVVNDSVSSTIEGSLRFPLPTGATVVRYAFEIGGKMVDALALSNRRAAEVAYKEREAGRSVSKTEKIEGNLFETTIYPLEYNVSKRLILTYTAELSHFMAEGKSNKWEVTAPFKFAKPVTVSTSVTAYPENLYTVSHNSTQDPTESTLQDGLIVSIIANETTSSTQPEVTFGSHLNKVHFSVFVPREYVSHLFKDASVTASSGTKRVCVLWDSSLSCLVNEDGPKAIQGFFNDLEAAHSQRGEKVIFTLYSFSTYLEQLGTDLTASAAISKISEISYDGGTNLACLSPVFTAQAKKESNYDYFILYSDGVDNIGDGTRLPDGISTELGVPINILSTGSETVNQNLLKCIALQTRSYLGKLSTSSAQIIAGTQDDFAVTDFRPALSLGEGREDALIDLFQDETFATVPDWRLGDRSYWPVSETGVLMTGILPGNTKATPDSFEVTFMSRLGGKKTVSVPFPTTATSTGGPLVHEGEVGRLVGLSHCHNMIAESRALRFDPVFSRDYIERVAQEYNTVSDYTSLLLLHSAIQFIDNDLDCPLDHPEYAEWKVIKSKQETTEQIKALRKEVERLEKLESISNLAEKLVRYYTEQSATTIDAKAKELLEIKITTISNIKYGIGRFFEQAQNEIAEFQSQLRNSHSDVRCEQRSIESDTNSTKSELDTKYAKTKPRVLAEKIPEVDEMYKVEDTRISSIFSELKRIGFSDFSLEDNLKVFDDHIHDLEARAKEWSELLQAEEDKYRREVEDWEKSQEEKRTRALTHFAISRAAAEKKITETRAHLKELEAQFKVDQKEPAWKDIDGGPLKTQPLNRSADDLRYRSLNSRDCNNCCSRACNDMCRFKNCCVNRTLHNIKPVRTPEYYFQKWVLHVERIRARLADIEGKTKNFEEAVVAFKAEVEKNQKAAAEILPRTEEKSKAYYETFEGKVKSEVDSRRQSELNRTAAKREQVRKSNERTAKVEAAASHEDYMIPVKEALLGESGSVEVGYAEYLNARNAHKASPSFFIYNARLFFAAEAKRELVTRIITNTLELNIQDVQMFRSVAYFMLEIGSTEEAIALFRRVQDKAPGEPHSFLDLGMALYFDVRKKYKNGEISQEELKERVNEAIQNLAVVLCGKWPDRFFEIEWPVLIWLNWIVGFAAHAELGDLWPNNVEEFCRVPGMAFDLVVALGWDTDHTDIDLHIQEPQPNGDHVCFYHKDSATNGHFSRDFRQGYGPECYLIKHVTPGFYDISTTYFSSWQASKSTGTTSCVVWSVKWLGHYNFEEFDFKMVRLDKNGSSKEVMSIDMVW